MHNPSYNFDYDLLSKNMQSSLHVFTKNNWKFLYPLAEDFKFINTCNSPQFQQIYPDLLHPEERIVRLPIQRWMNILINKSSTFDIKNLNTKNSIIDLMILINQSTLLLTYLGCRDLASSTCKKSIIYLNALYQKTANHYFLAQAIQPWINLGRLDKICKNYNAAVEKFDLLGNPDEHNASATKRIVSQAIIQARTRYPEVNNVVTHCSVLENLKLSLIKKDFSAIINYHAIAPSFTLQSVIAESKIIAAYYVDFNYYKNFIFQSLNNKSIKYLHVFIFRAAELYFLLDEQSQLSKLIIGLHGLCLEILNQQQITADLLLFVFSTCNLLTTIDSLKLSSELLKKLYSCYLKLDDELGIVSCLNLLKQADVSNSGLYHDKLNSILATSEYISLRAEKSIELNNKTQRLIDNINILFSQV